MRRIVIARPGGYGALAIVEEPDPVAGRACVRVAIKAIGVNYADVIVRMGHYEAAKGLYPLSPGFEFSGVVDSCGPGATHFRPGDRVLGFTRFGAYASSIVVSEQQLFRCPEGWDFAPAAAFPAVFLTAYHGLFQVAKVSAGESLLIHSAAGGMGTALLQLGRLAGCRLVGVVGAPGKRRVCEAFGAEAVIDRSSEDLWARAKVLCPEGYDAIFDANGVSTLRAGFNQLAPGGRLVVYGFADILPRGKAKPSLARLAWNYLRVPKFSPLEMTMTNRSVMGFNVVFLFNKLGLAMEAMDKMLGWVAEGRLQKPQVTCFAFEDVAKAHQAIESGVTTGKLVLTVA